MDDRIADHSTDQSDPADLPRLPFERSNPLDVPEMYRTLRTTAGDPGPHPGG
ncbi:pentalenolactone synthase [Streptosporangium subroseum]|uniref:Pentalenolactone synthase n=1 Tax=Streptosporangium subroseum TaxID=106412 RepID=A0A239BAH1_9ACTN|nr:hypothetical protein [Streptosporangium subroseum]SNS04880.1 pentalenolactone synthase [Streptosporangium subroseum]